MEPVSLTLAAVAAAGSIYGTISSFLSNKKAEEQALYYGGLQADEILRRNAYNEQILKDNEEDYESKVSVSAGRGGVYTGLGDILRSRVNLERNLIMYKQEAEFKAKMARQGASNQAELYSDRATASLLSGAGQVAGYAANAYQRNKDFSSPNQAEDLSSKVEFNKDNTLWYRDPRNVA